MSRATRSFKLRLSPAGMDLLIDCHCHLIRATRCLIPWGTTLHVAVVHLSTIATSEIDILLDSLSDVTLSGQEEHHVGAPHNLAWLAAAISARLDHVGNRPAPPSLGTIYLLAFHCLLAADTAHLLQLYERMKSGAVLPTN